MSSSATAERPSAPPVETVPPEPLSQRENRARLDAILTAAGMVGWEWDVERNIVHHLGDIGALTGRTWGAGDRLTHFVHPDDRTRFAEKLRDCWLGADEDYRQEFRILRPDGEIRWVSDVGSVATFADGRRWMSGVLTDITERKRAEAAAAHSRARLDYALQAAGMIAWDWDPESGAVAHTEDPASPLAPVSTREAFAEQIHPDDQARAHAAFAEAFESGAEYRQEYRLVSPDGRVRWMASRGRALTGPDGRRRMSGVINDISDRKLADDQRHLLINELNHRVKNTLAIVQGVAGQTFRGRSDDQARIFQGRLLALSTAHNVLTRENWKGAGMQEIVADAIRPFADPDGDNRVSAEGEDVRLPPKTVVALAMALHELGANAVRHGALSTFQGRVQVRWRAERERLRLTWSESGGPPVAAPEKRGFGTRMIERGLAAELGGAVKISFEPQGVVCTVDAPLPNPETPASESHA